MLQIHSFCGPHKTVVLVDKQHGLRDSGSATASALATGRDPATGLPHGLPPAIINTLAAFSATSKELCLQDLNIGHCLENEVSKMEELSGFMGYVLIPGLLIHT